MGKQLFEAKCQFLQPKCSRLLVQQVFSFIACFYQGTIFLQHLVVKASYQVLHFCV